MRFFHLGDLHIGKKVNHVSMLDEQRYVLKQVLAYADEMKPDVVLLCGDLYDRRNPSLEAIGLLDDFLTELILQRHIQVLAIGGNHDSGERLDFANGLLAKVGLHMEGALRLPIPCVRIHDEYGPIDFHMLPFADMPTLKFWLDEEEDITSYDELMKKIVDKVVLADDARHVLLYHGLLIGDGNLEHSDSERELFIGGTDAWESKRLRDFHYVALGHLHRFQQVSHSNIYYSGSFLKYSFSEEKDQKVCLCVDLDRQGEVLVQTLPLTPQHDMATIKGSLEDLLDLKGDFAEHQEDYLRIVLTDKEDLIEPMARLRKIYSNIMVLEKELDRDETLEGSIPSIKPQRRKQADELFIDFHQELYGEEPSDEQVGWMRGIFNIVRRELI